MKKAPLTDDAAENVKLAFQLQAKAGYEASNTAAILCVADALNRLADIVEKSDLSKVLEEGIRKGIFGHVSGTGTTLSARTTRCPVTGEDKG